MHVCVCVLAVCMCMYVRACFFYACSYDCMCACVSATGLLRGGGGAGMGGGAGVGGARVAAAPSIGHHKKCNALKCCLSMLQHDSARCHVITAVTTPSGPKKLPPWKITKRPWSVRVGLRVCSGYVCVCSVYNYTHTRLSMKSNVC